MQDLDTLIGLSQAMLDALAAEDWEQLVRLEPERDALVRRLFAAPPAPPLAQPLVERIQRIRELDQALVAASNARLEALRSARRHLQQGRKAVRRYQESP